MVPRQPVMTSADELARKAGGSCDRKMSPSEGGGRASVVILLLEVRDFVFGKLETRTPLLTEARE